MIKKERRGVRIDNEVKSVERSRSSRVPIPDTTEPFDATDPKHNQVAETTTPRLELFKETVHVEFKVTISTPRSPLKGQSRDPERRRYASRAAASDVEGKQLAGESLCRTCEMSSWENAVIRERRPWRRTCFLLGSMGPGRAKMAPPVTQARRSD